MDLKTAIQGVLDSEQELSHVGNDPTKISQYMYELGQYTSAAEKHLGECEREFESKWSDEYAIGIRDKLSATAAKQLADVNTAEIKGQIKYLTRFVGSAWKVHMSAMARHKHLSEEMKGTM